MTMLLAGTISMCADRCMPESETRNRGNQPSCLKLLGGAALLDICTVVTCLVLVILAKSGLVSMSPTALYITMGIGGGVSSIWALIVVSSAIKKCCMSKEQLNNDFESSDVSDSEE